MTYSKLFKIKKASNTMKSSMESHTIKTQESLFLQEKTGATFTSSIWIDQPFYQTVILVHKIIQ